MIFRRIVMAQNKTGHMRGMISVWLRAAWVKMHGRMCENRISDPSNESLPGPADRAERAYKNLVMDIHDGDHDFDRHQWTHSGPGRLVTDITGWH